jgi:hypothetical protein
MGAAPAPTHTCSHVFFGRQNRSCAFSFIFISLKKLFWAVKFSTGYSERALQVMINSKLSKVDFLSLLWSRFWEFFWGAFKVILKSRLQLNYVPVHETHSAKVR